MAYRREPRPDWDCQTARAAAPYFANRQQIVATGFDDDEAETVALRRPQLPPAAATRMPVHPAMNATRPVPMPVMAPSSAPVPRPDFYVPELLAAEPPVPMPRSVAIRPIWVITALLLLAISYRVLPYAVARVGVVDTTLDHR